MLNAKTNTRHGGAQMAFPLPRELSQGHKTLTYRKSRQLT